MTKQTKRRVTFGRIISLSLVCTWLCLAAFPFIWTFWGSFKVQSDFFSKADWMNALWGTNTLEQTGSAFTSTAYQGAWVIEKFWKNFMNTGIVVLSTVVISLTFGTLGGHQGFRKSEK